MNKRHGDLRRVPGPATSDHTRPLEALAVSINLPGPTLDALIRNGKGPPVFKIGRRVYCRVADFNSWLDDVAAGKVDATLANKRRHTNSKPRPSRDAERRVAP